MNLNTNHTQPQRLFIQQYFSGELSVSESETMRIHLQTCTVCHSYFLYLESEKKQFLNTYPSMVFLNNVHSQESTWFQHLRDTLIHPTLVPVYATIFIICCILPIYFRQMNSPLSPHMRTKGMEQLSFLYRHNDRVFEGRTTDTISAMDEVQIVYSSSKRQYISLFSIDMKGHISFYFPKNSSKWCSIKTEKGAGLHYPLGIALDTTQGQELIIALFTKKRVRVKDVQRWIKTFTDKTPFDLSLMEQELKTKRIRRNDKTITLLLNKK